MFESITQYVELFQEKNANNRWDDDWGGIYDKDFERFIKDLLTFVKENQTYNHTRYHDNLLRYGFIVNKDLVLDFDLSQTNDMVLINLMICLLRIDYGEGGFLCDFVREGKIIPWLLRLRQIDAGGSVVRFHKPEELHGYLSNWYMSEFTLHDTCYCCAEQYMMQQKALLFGDKEMAQKIMKVYDPQLMQSFGQQVQGFVPAIWDGQKQLIVYDALFAKFSQNEDLALQLRRTGEAVLAECSWSDKTWGIGLGMDSADVKDTEKWKGKNLLGYALMLTRTRLNAMRCE